MPYTEPHNPRKVIFAREEVAAYVKDNPECGLQSTRAYWFEFDADAELIDTDVPDQDTGPGAAALHDIARAWLEDNDGRPATTARSAPAQRRPTPGPWSACATMSSDHYNIRNISGPNAEHIAVVAYRVEISQAEALANARLIAAAPELLEALRCMLDMYGPRNGGIEWDGPCDAARAAIAKAAGGQP